MKKSELLLSEEFSVFSKKIGELHALNKAKNEEFKVKSEDFKKLYDLHKQEIAQINNAVEILQNEWDNYVKTLKISE